MARIARADVGPLASYADGYRELLAGLGYTPDGVVRKLWELGRLSDWMIRNRLDPQDLTTTRFDEFSALCKAGVERPVGYRTLAPLVGYLRELGAVPGVLVGATPVDDLVVGYRSWMVTDRALAARTVERYEATARRFLDSARTVQRAVMLRTLIGLLAVTGMRVGEALRLTDSDIDRATAVTTIRASKFNKSRHVPVTASTIAALDACTAVRNEAIVTPKCPNVFVSGQGTPVAYTHFCLTFRRPVTAAGCRPENPMSLRLLQMVVRSDL